MADINIAVNESTDLYTITLDRWEWTGLKVNGKTIKAINKGNIQFQYRQSCPGPVHFIATANHNISLVKPGDPIYLKGLKKTYICLITYQEVVSPKKIVTLHGVLTEVSAVIADAQDSPIRFYQGKMSGSFHD